MICIAVSTLRGKEILGKDIITSSGVVLIPAGTMLKEEYIQKLKELKIYSVCIKTSNDEVSIEEQGQVIMQECTNQVKKLIEKHFYSTKSELSRLTEVADEIIQEALTKPEVLMTVNNIKHSSEDLYLHSVSVSVISVLIAAYMNIEKEKVKSIAVGALLHDVGYSYVNAELENYRKIGEIYNEKKELKKHVLYGYEMVQKESWISEEAKKIILCHHEKFDGSGYPLKISGKNIDIGSRIVSIANEFDNAINGKVSECMKVYLAIDMIVCKAETSFDKDVVNAFSQCVSAYPTGTVVITNEQEVGVVIKQNADFPTRPIIKIIRDKNGNDIKEEVIKDMKEHLTLFVEDTIE